MRLGKRLIGSSLAAGLVLTVTFAQEPDWSKVEVKSTKLADNLYMLEGSGGNIGLLTGPEGAVMVDDQFAPLAQKLQAAIAELTDKPVRFVLNTHYHFDHSQGNEAFGRAGAVIIAHDNTRTRLMAPHDIDTFNIHLPPWPAVALPVITFPQSMSLHLNGEDIEAIHLPHAHTDTDVALYFKKANVMHVGDVFAGNFFPFIDTEHGGSLDGVLAALDVIAKKAKPDTRFIRGHAPVGTQADLKEYQNMLVTVRKRILDGIKAGKTQEQVVASQPTKDFDAKFSGMIKPDLFVQRAYVDLRRNKSGG
jgi:cyclase